MPRLSALVVFPLAVALAALAQGQSPTSPREQGTIVHDGLTRQYELYRPPASGGPAPLVVMLHGGGNQDGSVSRMAALTRFDELAERNDVFVVYPYAIDQYWNDGRGLARYRSQSEDIDDVGFLVALVDRLARELPIDPARIYAAGASNGAMMAYRLGCERPDRFAAIAAVAGNLPSALACRPDRPISAIIINGTDDPFMPWNGGEVRFLAQRLGRVLSARATADHWARLAGCAPSPPRDALPDRDRDDRTRVFRIRFARCAPDTGVVLYGVEGGGHTWPGGPEQTSPAIVGRTSLDVDATELVWDFFYSHGR